MRPILLFLAFYLLSIPYSTAQNDQKILSKAEEFASKAGVISKIEDYKLGAMPLSYGAVAEARVRVITVNSDTRKLFQISYEGKYDTKVASFEESELSETIKAFDELKRMAAEDASKGPDYLENRFITDQGVQVGYFIRGKELMWFIKLEKYGSGNTIFPKSANIIEETFRRAKTKLAELN